MLEEGVGDHRHKRMSVKALPGSSLEVVKTKWRHSAWAERETAPKHRYWFEVSPDRTVKLLHSSSPVEEDCLKATQAVEEFIEGHKDR